MPISEIIENAYTLPSKINVVECGAMNPKTLETAGWTNSHNVWFIEANPSGYAILKKQGYNILNFGLSDINGTRKFCQSENWDCGYLELSGTNDSKVSGEHIKLTYDIECITYKKLLETLDVVFDVLILDIEGHEEKVLENMKHEIEKHRLPKILCVECGYEWEKRKEIVKALGYDLDFYYYNNAYFSMPDLSYEKNTDTIDSYNKQWTSWSYRGKLIYKNENTNI